VEYLLKARIVEQEKRILLGNGSVTLNKKLLDGVFSVQSVSMLYNEDQLSLGESPESAVREQEVGV
jgi:hypothetical protein